MLLRLLIGTYLVIARQKKGTATFLAQDRAILFMRYIRKHLEFLKKSREQESSLEFGNQSGQ